MPSFSIADASARIPRPEAFSERKSSSMMTMGKWKRNIVRGLRPRRGNRAARECRTDSAGRSCRYTACRVHVATEGATMSMAAPTVWWVVAGVLVAVELATGTFYLLMLALGAVAGALTAHAGGTLSTQLLAAAIVGGGAVAAWHLRRARQPAAPPAEANRDINLDIGTRVQVSAWNADGTARVPYRG